MPLVEVTYRPGTPVPALEALAEHLPHEVSMAVRCDEEPYDGDLRPGDVEVRFRELGPLDVSGMDIVVEVKSKWAPERARVAQGRADALCARLTAITGAERVGVYLTLPAAVWSQT